MTGLVAKKPKVDNSAQLRAEQEAAKAKAEADKAEAQAAADNEYKRKLQLGRSSTVLGGNDTYGGILS